LITTINVSLFEIRLFFFEDTATPEIYTLSLHDALPIWLLLLLGRAAQVQLLQGRRWAEEARARRTERIVLPARRGALLDRHGGRDRKSTRLNSSHVAISYAVFCLKKKIK